MHCTLPELGDVESWHSNRLGSPNTPRGGADSDVCDEPLYVTIDIQIFLQIGVVEDMDKPCLGDVYDGMDTMVEKVKIEIQKHENDPIQCETLCNTVEIIIHRRWEQITTPLQLLAYALSPRYYSVEVLAMPDRVGPYVDEKVANGCYKAFERLFKDDEMH